MNDLKYYGVVNVNKDMIGFYPSKGAQFIQAQSCLNDEIEKTKKDHDDMKNNCICTGVALFCIKKYIETHKLSFDYSDNKDYPEYTLIADDINKACANIETFDECLSRFGLKFESKTDRTGGYPYNLWMLNLSKLEE